MNEGEKYTTERIKMVVAQNLAKYRKAAKFTQLELAEKLLYSDKNISKWERGESIPDVVILKQIADIFGITVNDFLCENGSAEVGAVQKHKKYERTKFFSKQQFLITFLSVCIVWFVAVVGYSLFVGLMPSSQVWVWKFFIVAIAVSNIVTTVFTAIWCTNFLNSVSVSFLIWTTALSVFVCVPFENNWLLFITAIPLQVIVIFWFIFMKLSKANRKSHEQFENKPIFAVKTDEQDN